MIVADGASQDETLAVLGSFAGIVSHVDSQQDDGVYDAMNRGVSNVSAPWIWVMGAGDIPTEEGLKRALDILTYAESDAAHAFAVGSDKLAGVPMDSGLGQRHALAEHHASPRPHRSKFMVEVTSLFLLTACLAITQCLD